MINGTIEEAEAERRRTNATWRFAILRPYLEGDLPLTDCVEEMALSLRTARRWLSAYRRDGINGLTRAERSHKGRRVFPEDLVTCIEGMVADMELRFIKDRQRAGIETAKAQGVYKGRAKNVDDAEIRRRIDAGATKAAVARSMKISRMTVYRALDDIPDKVSLPDKPPAGIVMLRLEPPDRSIARSRVTQTRRLIEELLERDYGMTGSSKDGSYRLQIVYDPEPEGMSFADEIEHLRTEIGKIMEAQRCLMAVEITEVQRRSWEKK